MWFLEKKNTERLKKIKGNLMTLGRERERNFIYLLKHDVHQTNAVVCLYSMEYFALEKRKQKKVRTSQWMEIISPLYT